MSNGGTQKGGRAVIVGYHGMRNLGDDLFREIISEWLIEHVQPEEIAVMARKGRLPDNFKGIPLKAIDPPVVSIHRMSYLRLLFTAWRSRITVFGGGSIFTILPFRLVAGIIRLLAARGVTLVGVGVSLGPFRTESDRRRCFGMLNRFKAILFREASLVGILKPGNGQRFICSYDIVLSKYRELAGGFGCEGVGGGGVVSLAMNARDGAEGEQGRKVIATAVGAVKELLRSRSNVVIRLITICSDERDGDAEVMRAIGNSLTDWPDRVEWVAYNGTDPVDFAKQITSSSVVIASRMHAGILAMLAGVPTLQVSYAEKIDNFFANGGLETSHLMSLGNLSQSKLIAFVTEALNGGWKEYFERQRFRLVKLGESVSKDLDSLGSFAAGKVS